MPFGATYINYNSTVKDREDNYYFPSLENREDEKWCDVLCKKEFLQKFQRLNATLLLVYADAELLMASFCCLVLR